MSSTASDRVLSLSQDLKRWQMASGLSLRDIGEMLDIDHVAVHRAVSGAGSVPAANERKLRRLLDDDEEWEALSDQIIRFRLKYAHHRRIRRDT